MKKLIVIISAAFVFLALAACGNGNNKTGSTTTTNSGNTGVVGDVMDDIKDGVLGAEDEIMSAADDVIGGEDDIIGDEREDSLMANDDIAADNSVNSTTTEPDARYAESRSAQTRATSSRKTAETKEGELNRLASLVGKDDSAVIAKLGKGKRAEKNGEKTSLREFDAFISGSREKATVYYSGRGKVERITISPDHKGLVGTLLALTKDFGEPDRISSDGLSYDYLANWKTKDASVTLLKWHDIVTITME